MGVADTILVAGGGISGLSRAWTLAGEGADVTVWDAGSAPGGAIRSFRQDGFLIEGGPNSLQNGDVRIRSWIASIGLGEELLAANRTASKRYIYLDGRPIPTPDSALGALRTPLLSLSAKMRILREPWIPKRTDSRDESLAGMVRRRLGSEFLDHLINPMVAGIYAGDPETLSVRHAFPKLWRLEQDHGSFIRGAMAKRRAGPTREILTFRDGLQTLPHRLASLLADRYRPNSPLHSLERDGDGFRANGVYFRNVVVAMPPHNWPRDGFLSTHHAPLPQYTGVASVSVGFRQSDIRHPIDGFGMLVPAKERRNLLGVLFPSAIFPHRAPDGHHLLTCFIGGARQPDLLELEDDRLISLVLDELRLMLGVVGVPTTISITRWARAIPQYSVGYDAVLDGFARLGRDHPGLTIAGNHRDGIGIDQCIAAGLP